MKTIVKLLEEHKINYTYLSKKKGYDVYHIWLKLFAEKVKKMTGNYTINGYVFEAYSSGILPSLDGEKGVCEYTSKEAEEYYMIFENGDKVFDCHSIEWPVLFGVEVIIFPKTKNWSMIFSHEETMYYVEPSSE